MRKNSLTRGDVNNYLKALYQVGGAELYVDSIPSIENYQYSYPDATVDEAEEWARSMTDKYDSPLYTYSRKNTPDCVLNFYYQETLDNDALYLGALIMDFKYKKRHSVWFDYDTYKNYKSEANLQFNSYKNQMCTIFMGDCTGDNEDISLIFIFNQFMRCGRFILIPKTKVMWSLSLLLT